MDAKDSCLNALRSIARLALLTNCGGQLPVSRWVRDVSKRLPGAWWSLFAREAYTSRWHQAAIFSNLILQSDDLPPITIIYQPRKSMSNSKSGNATRDLPPPSQLLNGLPIKK